MILYEPIIGNTALDDLNNFPELIKYVRSGAVAKTKKEIKEYRTKINAKNKKQF